MKTKLEEEFPKLKNRGGFEILRSGFSSGKSLVLLRPPASVGYSRRKISESRIRFGATIGLYSSEEVSLSDAIAS